MAQPEQKSAGDFKHLTRVEDHERPYQGIVTSAETQARVSSDPWMVASHQRDLGIGDLATIVIAQSSWQPKQRRLTPLSALYEIKDPDVHHWLAGKPDVEALLTEAQEQIARVFGEETATELQVDAESGKLFALIKTDAEAGAAWQLFQELMKWWREERQRADHEVILHMEPA
jgi:hypothetical protein